MNTPVTLDFGGVPGIVGQVTLPAKQVSDLTLPSSTSGQEITLPVGMTTAAFVAIVALGMADLTYQLAGHGDYFPVPAGGVALVFGVAPYQAQAASLKLSSALGGQCQVIIG